MKKTTRNFCEQTWLPQQHEMAGDTAVPGCFERTQQKRKNDAATIIVSLSDTAKSLRPLSDIHTSAVRSSANCQNATMRLTENIVV